MAEKIEVERVEFVFMFGRRRITGNFQNKNFF